MMVEPFVEPLRSAAALRLEGWQLTDTDEGRAEQYELDSDGKIFGVVVPLNRDATDYSEVIADDLRILAIAHGAQWPAIRLRLTNPLHDVTTLRIYPDQEIVGLKLKQAYEFHRWAPESMVLALRGHYCKRRVLRNGGSSAGKEFERHTLVTPASEGSYQMHLMTDLSDDRSETERRENKELVAYPKMRESTDGAW